MVHELQDYNLFINDDDYLVSSFEEYENIANEACDCWDKFITKCEELKDVFEGETASGIIELYVDTIGGMPGEELKEALKTHKDNMENYISDIDEKDDILY